MIPVRPVEVRWQPHPGGAVARLEAKARQPGFTKSHPGGTSWIASGSKRRQSGPWRHGS